MLIQLCYANQHILLDEAHMLQAENLVFQHIFWLYPDFE